MQISKADIQLAAPNTYVETSLPVDSLYESMFVHCVVPICLSDENMRIIRVNDAFLKASGYQREEVEGVMSTIDFLSDKVTVLGQKYHHLRMNASSELFQEVEYIVRCKDGAEYPARVTATVLPGSTITAHTVHDLRPYAVDRASEQTQRLESLGVLAGGIAHDFNNILTAVLGYADLAVMDKHHPARLSHNLKEIIDSAQRARDLVSHILTFSQKSIIQREPVSLREIIKDSLAMFRALVPPTVEIDCSIDCVSSLVLADSTQMHQIVMNLCTNAFHAMQDGGTLSIHLNHQLIGENPTGPNAGLKPGNYLRLEVRDSGCGITGDVLKRIFEPYFTTKRPGEGTGMGLAMVHGIISEHEGSIHVESEEDVGTSFIITLPHCDLKPPSDTAGAPRRAARFAGPSKRATIMVVDDETKIRRLQHRFLEQLSCDVATFENGAVALEAFLANPDGFDLIITDLTMPIMDGKTLASHVRAIRPACPIILSTGLNDTCEPSEEGVAISGQLKKPFMKEDLAEILERHLV